MTQQQFLTTVYKNEDQFTAAVHSYVNHNYPELRKFYFHVANESIGGMAIIMKRKAMGVLEGVPDFCFLKPKLWWLELKIPNGVLSPNQKKLHELWRSNSEIIFVAYNAEQVINAIESQIK